MQEVNAIAGIAIPPGAAISQAGNPAASGAPELLAAQLPGAAAHGAQPAPVTGFPVARPDSNIAPRLKEYGAQLSQGIRDGLEGAHSLTQLIDMNDPLMTMWRITDVNVQMQQAFAQLSIAQGAVGAANNFLSTLLKNQG